MKINKFEIISILTEEECSLYSFLGYLSPADKDFSVAKDALLELLNKGYVIVKVQGRILDVNEAKNALLDNTNYKSREILVSATKTGEDYYQNDSEVKLYFKEK